MTRGNQHANQTSPPSTNHASTSSSATSGESPTPTQHGDQQPSTVPRRKLERRTHFSVGPPREYSAVSAPTTPLAYETNLEDYGDDGESLPKEHGQLDYFNTNHRALPPITTPSPSHDPGLAWTGDVEVAVPHSPSYQNGTNLTPNGGGGDGGLDEKHPADDVAIPITDPEFDVHGHEAHKLVRRATGRERKEVAQGGGGVLSSLLHLYGQQQRSADKKLRSSAAKPGGGRARPSKPLFSSRPRSYHHANTAPSTPFANAAELKGHRSTATLSGLLLGSSMLGSGWTPPDSARTSISDEGGLSGFSTAYSSSNNLLDQLRIQENIRDILRKHDLMIQTARALLLFGSPSHRLEGNMQLLAKRLQVNCSVANLPGLLLFAFHDPDTHTSETHMLRIPMGGYHMSRLKRTNGVVRALMAYEISLDDAATELREMIEKPAYLPWYITLANYCVVSFVAAPLLFGGGWVDAAVSGAVGLVVGGMSLVASRLISYANVFEVTAAVFSGVMASVLSQHVCYWGVVLSAMVNLLPGLSLTLAVTELASRNVISGSVRLFYALVVAFLIGFGLSFGTRLYTSSGNAIDNASYTCQPISKYFWFLFFPIISFNFNMYLKADLIDYIPMTLISAAGFTTNYFASQYFDANYFAPAIASFVIATLSNVYSKLFSQMAISSILAGILLLVPGSLGVKGSLSMLTSDSNQAYEFSLQMVIISLSVSVGLFVSSLLVYPFGKKHNVLLTI
ncbi:pheromone-regulated protein prm10 [Dimargaris verticillata]|uniref:Pheromone-regulated protein prm10 n=1 Tax=Dimargaris verticillata TaxID=2761393 RepID=A0A9W8B4X0_9FUNG|nr:pheromone-regulated protein prm10 [Dimargaris verticillata]